MRALARAAIALVLPPLAGITLGTAVVGAQHTHDAGQARWGALAPAKER